jgi:hypothetical protein
MFKSIKNYFTNRRKESDREILESVNFRLDMVMILLAAILGALLC